MDGSKHQPQLIVAGCVCAVNCFRMTAPADKTGPLVDTLTDVHPCSGAQRRGGEAAGHLESYRTHAQSLLYPNLSNASSGSALGVGDKKGEFGVHERGEAGRLAASEARERMKG